MYTVEDRNQLFTVTLRHITALLPKIEKSKVVGLDRKLLAELLEAGLKCPGFNERQKFALVMASKVSTEHHRLSATARYWPFDTLSMKANSSDATMMVSEESTQSPILISSTNGSQALREPDPERPCCQRPVNPNPGQFLPSSVPG